MIRTATVFFVLFVLFLFTATTLSAATWLVRPDGTGDYAVIQDAVDAAGVSGDIIELADGIFTGAGNRDIDLLGKAVTIRSESGNRDACVIDCEGSAGTPRRGFHIHNGEGPGTVIERITIRNGYAVDFPGGWPADSGGGVLADGASPTLIEVAFRENTAYDGGGMLCTYNADATLDGCYFEGNDATHAGGAMYHHHNSLPLIRNTTFFSNTGYASAGGIMIGDASHSTFEDCVFSENVVVEHGGAIHIRYSNPTFTNVVFWKNRGEIGGGMMCHNSDAVLTNCTFYGNRADTFGGGMLCREYASPILINTIIAFSSNGVALYCDESMGANSPVLSCSDLYGNAGGDWTGCIATQGGTNGNFSLDPLFCDAPNGDVTIDQVSPCLDAPGCGLVGALGEGCSSGTSTEATSWGGVKMLFR